MTSTLLRFAFFTAFLFSLALNLSYAQQSIYGTSATPASATPKSNRVMTPEEFKNAAKKRSQEVNSRLDQQANQIMKAPSTPSSTVPPTGMPTTPAVTGSSPTSLPPMQTPSTPTTSAPAPVKQDVYTGFGPAPSNQPKANTKPAPSGNSSGGGWNIKY